LRSKLILEIFLFHYLGASMSFQKTLLASAVVVLAATAQAQTAPAASDSLTITNGVNSATLYGLIEATFSNKNAATSSNDATTGFQTAWFSGNRWGIAVKRDLGSGMKALAKLESEFDYQTGAEDTAGVLFNRDSWVGLEGSFGKLSLGRQNAIGRDFTGAFGDPYGGAKVTTEEGGYTNTNNFKQLIYYSGSATGTRYDRGVVWKKDFGGLVAGLGYQASPTPTAPNTFNTTTTQTGVLAYNGNGYTLVGMYNSANVKELSHSSVGLGGNIQLSDMVRINAGMFTYKAQQGAGGTLAQRSDTAWTLSAKITPSDKMDYQIGYQSMQANDAAVNAAGTSVLNAYADASAATTTVSGSRNTLYGSVFYHLDKSTDVYVAADRLMLNDRYVAGINTQSTQTTFATGLRLKF
jgi:predicted porin